MLLSKNSLTLTAEKKQIFRQTLKIQSIANYYIQFNRKNLKKDPIINPAFGKGHRQQN